MMDFEALAEERLTVRELCRRHVPSLLAFKSKHGATFHVLKTEPERGDDRLHHLTTTATCIESLEACHPTFWPRGAFAQFGESRKDALADIKRTFYSGAVKRNNWVSEGSAPIYCATRALPLFLQCNGNWTPKHSKLVASVFEQVSDGRRFGIGERTEKPKPPDPKWYPENAYHTYWALVVLGTIRNRIPAPSRDVAGLDLDRVELGMRLWARAKLAEEVALHWAGCAALDSDQLAWALTTFIQFEKDLSSDLRAQDLVRKAFEALGSTQERVGTWRHYRPLFVYSNVGNAYCYVFESFTYLLRALLEKFEKEKFLEGVVREFVGRLRDLRKYAEMTQVRDGNSDVVAWSSGHRPANPLVEGWATASVFSFLQAYRRLLGILARRDALRLLPRLVLPKDPAPLLKLAERGDTWPPPGGRGSVAADLITLFVNPVRMGDPVDRSEPDNQLFQENQARSAILFGPPGSSKTTLAQCVASALGWDYIELHSSHFVAEGIQAVQSTADRIFSQLRELDQAVVLFDEPDELVREREGAPDAFGRFLTTSMLPKVAQLWKQGRIIFFVATNHVRYFDVAITRSERFDVLVFVPPPSFRGKIDKLKSCMKGLQVKDPVITVTQLQVEKQLTKLESLRWGRPSGMPLPAEAQLAKFILLRWDQIDELACQLALCAPRRGTFKVDAAQLSRSLASIKDQRLSRLQTYLDFLDDLQYARKDFQRQPVFEVMFAGDKQSIPPEVERKDTGLWLRCPTGDCPQRLGRYKVVKTINPGKIKMVVD